MLKQLTISNYQAITNLTLSLAPYTVIVGPSSSGKSALTRAIKTLYSNKRGTAFINQRATSCTITATYTNETTLSLTRSTKTEPNHYTLNDRKFTKLAGTVPEEVTSALNIAPNSPLHFASQFDPPYLLADSPNEAAKKLSQLTDAHTLIQAAKQANSDKLQHSKEIKLREQDKEQLTNQLGELLDTSPLEQSLRHARKALEAVTGHESTLATLTYTLANLSRLESNLAALTNTARATVPDTAPIAALLESLATLHKLLAAVATLKDLQSTARATVPTIPALQSNLATLDTLRALQSSITKRLESLQHLKEQHKEHQVTLTEAINAPAEYLAELGFCPTCKQTTNH